MCQNSSKHSLYVLNPQHHHPPSVCVVGEGRGEVNDPQELLPPVLTFLCLPYTYLQHRNTIKMVASTTIPLQLCATSQCHSPLLSWYQTNRSSDCVCHTWKTKLKKPEEELLEQRGQKNNWHWLHLWSEKNKILSHTMSYFSVSGVIRELQQIAGIPVLTQGNWAGDSK